VSSTVDKALDLLSYFTQVRAEIGLSELARMAELDKATVHRLLQTLAKHGLVEQSLQSKLYRLGAGTLRLARNREASFPTATLVIDELRALSAMTGETSHASLIAGGSLATIGLVMGTKAIHVTLDEGESLPFHATASGIACMAFLPAENVTSILKQKLKKYTDNTTISTSDIAKAIEQTRARGYAVSDQSYESDVYGIAAPLFGHGGLACGAVAVATPAHRMTREIRNSTAVHVMEAATSISRKMGSEPPLGYLHAMRKAAA
jgi:IclR family transcriptional regulator, acetate operon repressor